jgi:hypothetical protein
MRTRSPRWLTLAALGIATVVQALAVVSSVNAILTHGV